MNLPSSYTTPMNGQYIYEYDKDRRLKDITFPSGTRHISNVWSGGRLAQTLTTEGTVTFGYDCAKIGSITKGGESLGYCLGDPVNFADPLGQDPATTGAVIGGTVAGPPGAALGAAAGVIAGVGVYALAKEIGNYLESRSNAGKQDPSWASDYVRYNPGKDPNGKCKPCRDPRSFFHPNQKSHPCKGHMLRYHQDEVTCECKPEKVNF